MKAIINTTCTLHCELGYSANETQDIDYNEEFLEGTTVTINSIKHDVEFDSGVAYNVTGKAVDSIDGTSREVTAYVDKDLLTFIPE